jgi:hypothetical protein
MTRIRTRNSQLPYNHDHDGPFDNIIQHTNVISKINSHVFLLFYRSSGPLWGLGSFVLVFISHLLYHCLLSFKLLFPLTASAAYGTLM